MRLLLLLLVVCLAAPSAMPHYVADDAVFREYKWNGPWVNARNWQRVTDPDARHAGAAEFLPNPVNTIEIDDLQYAVHAEVVMEQWGGHAGTSDKRIRFNEGEWLPVPEPDIGPEPPECYQYMRYPRVEIPLELLREGENTFEMTCSGQICFDYGWGQWGVYGVMVRVFYGDEKPRPQGAILSPAAGEEIRDRVVFEARASSDNGAIVQVDYVGLYEDFNLEGDGVNRQWKHIFRFCEITGHIGSATQPPYRVEWDASWLPDQEHPIAVRARITDASGLTAWKPIVDGLRLERPDYTVQLFDPIDKPPRWQTRAGQTQSCTVIVDSLDNATDALMLMTTWNGVQCDEIGLNGTVLMPHIGKDHDYSYDIVPVPLDLLQESENVFHTFSETIHHGIEVLWPGISLKIRYTR